MPAPADASRLKLLGRAMVAAVGAGAIVLAAHGAAPSDPRAPRAAAPVGSVPVPAVTHLAPDSDLVAESVSTGLRPVTRALTGVVAGEQSWVRIPWTTDAPVCSVVVTMAAPGAAIGYPVNTGSHSSFYRQDRLAASVLDYTSVRVLVPAFSAATVVTADVTASYTTTTTGSGSASKACGGPSVTRTYRVTLPVRPSPAAPAAALGDAGPTVPVG